MFVLDELGAFDGPLGVAVRGGVVEGVAPSLPTGEYEDVDGYECLWLMPGVFDCHANLACWEDGTLGYVQTPVTRSTLGLAANAKVLEMGGRPRDSQLDELGGRAGTASCDDG